MSRRLTNDLTGRLPRERNVIVHVQQVLDPEKDPDVDDETDLDEDAEEDGDDRDEDDE